MARPNRRTKPSARRPAAAKAAKRTRKATKARAPQARGKPKKRTVRTTTTTTTRIERVEDNPVTMMTIGSLAGNPEARELREALKNPSPEAQARIKAAMDAVVAAIERDDAVDMVARTMLAPVPSAKWSIGNRLIAESHGTHDARGFRQWLDAGRAVKKGARAFYILGPRRLTIEDKNEKTGETEKKSVLAGFVPIAVFRFEDTEGDPLPNLEPRDPPPLMDVAKAMGVSVRYSGGDGLAWGFYRPATDEIVLHTHAAGTFFHELAHAAHKRVRGSLKGGQDEEQEIVAEFSAAVLEKMYVPSSHHELKRHVRYIRGYANVKGPEAAAKRVMTLLAEIDRVLRAILDVAEAPALATARNPMGYPYAVQWKRRGSRAWEGDGRATLGEALTLAEQARAKGYVKVSVLEAPGLKAAARRAVSKNPSRGGLIRELRGPVRAAAHVDGFEENVAACREFHGCAPTRDHVFDFDDGKPETTEKVVFVLGKSEVRFNTVRDARGREIAIPEQRFSSAYAVPGKRSVKAGRQFIHSETEDGGRPHLRVCDAKTHIMSELGDYEVTDFIRERKR